MPACLLASQSLYSRQQPVPVAMQLGGHLLNKKIKKMQVTLLEKVFIILLTLCSQN